MKPISKPIYAIVNINDKPTVVKRDGYSITYDGIEYNILQDDSYRVYVLQDKNTCTTIKMYDDLKAIKQDIKTFKHMILKDGTNLQEYIRNLKYDDSTKHNRALLRAFKAAETKAKKG